MLLLLLGWGVSAQTVSATISLDLDKFTALIEQKDKKIESYQKLLNNHEGLFEDCAEVNSMLVKEIDSLKWFKLYYMHSKHVITPRVIGKIEEMIN